ncbi:HEAT repeat domain-containing protein [Methanosarcina sp. DH2]|uniref:HEAT repeat domain-containing protein n=1 Tax=Methanosarcina sp. DH2 TaxID=2605639 RepID=UPI001E2E0A13|nr:HEAT repeat domain-containing protein [Methanosarcina sp. DH2]
MIDQEKIHNQCLNDDPKKRIYALRHLGLDFYQIPDKQQAWDDLHRLTNDEDSNVRSSAAEVLGSLFSQMPDKQQAWNDLHRLVNDEDSDVRYSAAEALGSAFSQVPDKQQAWDDLHRLVNDEDSDVRYYAAEVLDSTFSQMPDKQQVWDDLVKLTSNEDSDVRYSAAGVLGSLFSQVPDKQQAWNDLHRLINDENSFVRDKATSALGSVFSQVLDKQQAWNDLYRLTNDEYGNVRSSAAEVLDSMFSHMPDKQQALDTLIKLTNDEDRSVRSSAAEVLGSLFSQMSDKQQAWNDLHRLVNDEDSDVRYSAAEALGSAFSQVLDKQQAWNDLHRLTSDENNFVRDKATSALGSAFSQVLDKQQAWNDLHRLTSDIDRSVRYSAAEALGSAFSQVPDKQQAWDDLHRLTDDQDMYVRIYANHSLGRVSIFMASKSEKEEEYERELETAITFFEKAAKEATHYNPAQFCLPFYRSFHTIIFEKQDAKEEVDKYLKEAKDAIRGSKSKETLLEAVENLAEALKEVHSLGNLDLEAQKSELNFYRQYCDRAAELMDNAEETAPFAVRAMKIGLPILDRNLKRLIEEIQKKAKIACRESKDTDAEEIVCEINKEIQNIISDDQKQYIGILEDIVSILKIKIPSIPENKFIFRKIESLDNKMISPEKYSDLLLIISMMPTMKVVSEQELDHKLLKLDLIYDKTVSIEAKLDLIQKELDRGLEKLDILSLEVGGKEGELIQTFSKKILELTEKGDKEALNSFLENIIKKENILIEEIENSFASLEEKKESKSNVSKIRSVLDKVKHPIKSFGKDVTNEIIVGYAAEEIVKLVFQLVSMATLGVPIPPQILNLISSMTKDLKNYRI